MEGVAEHLPTEPMEPKEKEKDKNEKHNAYEKTRACKLMRCMWSVVRLLMATRVA